MHRVAVQFATLKIHPTYFTKLIFMVSCSIAAYTMKITEQIVCKLYANEKTGSSVKTAETRSWLVTSSGFKPETF